MVTKDFQQNLYYCRNKVLICTGVNTNTNLGKSILAVQIADSISEGESIRGFKLEAEKQKVLSFDFEMSDKQFEKRYQLLPFKINSYKSYTYEYKDDRSNCSYCEAHFSAKRYTATYYSASCRQMAYAKRVNERDIDRVCYNQ